MTLQVLCLNDILTTFGTSLGSSLGLSDKSTEQRMIAPNQMQKHTKNDETHTKTYERPTKTYETHTENQ